MITKEELAALPKGSYTNSQLRSMLGNRHGTPVLMETKDNKVVIITGNRKSAKIRQKNPIRKKR